MEGADWDPIVHRVLAGNVDPAELPEIPQRVVRVYLSSTGVGKHFINNLHNESCQRLLPLILALTYTCTELTDNCLLN